MKYCKSCAAQEADHDTKFIVLDGVLMCEECVTEVLRKAGTDYLKLADDFYQVENV
jgi:hypothetical protein